MSNLDNMYCIDLRTPRTKDYNSMSSSSNVDNHNYGSTVTEQEFAAPRQTFSIAEPGHSDTTPLRSNNGNGKKRSNCCVAAAACRRCLCGGSSSNNNNSDGDGLKIIVVSMFVFAIAVTVALVFQIASGISTSAHSSDVSATDHPNCTEVSNFIMASGGNAVDAAVAAAFCLAAVAPHMTGIGGGGVMLVHKHRENETTVIDFREATPNSVRSDRYQANPNLSLIGRGSIGVPGFLAGLAHAHKKFGSGHVGLDCCSWSQIVMPAIKVGRSIMSTQNLIYASNTRVTAEELTQPDAKHLEPEGHELTLNTLLYDLTPYKSMLESLELIARDGPDAFYKGEVGKLIVDETGGQITEEDLKEYKVSETKHGVQTKIGSFQVISTPAPSSGPQVLSILNAMEEYQKRYGITPANSGYLRNISQVLERTESYFLGLGDAFGDDRVADRTQWMLDKQNAYRYLNKNEGDEASDVSFRSSYKTSEPVGVSATAMDRQDIYVSVVTSLNTWFGSKVMTSNGILLNNALSNFAPESADADSANSANTMSSGRHPLFLGAPALAIDTDEICGQRMLLGGASADILGQVLSDTLVFGQDLSSSIGRDRLRRDPSHPASVRREGAYSGSDPLDPAAINQAFGGPLEPILLPYLTVNGVDKTGDTVLAVSDNRSL